MELPKLTVIVPTRNEADNIPGFLESLPPEVQLVAVDASQDHTPDLIAMLRPDRTSIIRHPGHVTQARQIGAEAARTSWLLFTDADVIFAPDYFDRLQRLDGYDALYGPKLSQDQFMGYYRWFSQGQSLSDRLGIPAVSGSNMLANRQVFMDVGGFDVRLSCNEDSELGWRIKRQGYRIAFARELVVYARDHRRLRRGVTLKTIHSLSRCLLLYLNLIPDRWRGRDWGYWSRSRKSGGTPNEDALVIE
jgi:glycosyltransferase involved in cell wall biosynthesis